MEEIHTGEALEIAVEGDEPATRRDGEGSEVGVRPQMMREACGAGQGIEVLVKGGRLHQKLQDRNGKKLPVNNPRLVRTQRIGQYAGMSAKAQKPQRGDAAKSERLGGLFFPKAAGSWCCSCRLSTKASQTLISRRSVTCAKAVAARLDETRRRLLLRG